MVTDATPDTPADGSDEPPAQPPTQGPLGALRDRLEHVDGVPLPQRPALLEQANAALVDALGDLEEV